MSFTLSFQKTLKSAPTLIVPVTEKKLKSPPIENKAVLKFVKHALKTNPQFEAGHGQSLILTPPENDSCARIILLGLGDDTKLNAITAEQAGGKLIPSLKSANITKAALQIDENIKTKTLKSEEIAAALLNGMRLRSYNFDIYKSKKDDKKSSAPKTLEKLTLVHPYAANVKALYQELAHVTDGTFQARDLVNMPPNDLYPEAYAKRIKDELKPLGVEIEILDEKKMLKMGMGAIMAVGKGSERQPRMVIMKWNGAPKKIKTDPLVFVGKGVTFDTGGISIKPSAGMDEMKMDMGGSAAVVGLMKTLALRKAKTNVIGIVGLAENMPSSNAYRPGDILTSYSGQTIEVLNTDAEGRLVLADCLSYIQEIAKPKFIIDLATLTGAMMVALGHEYCGTFANDDDLWKDLSTASTTSGEKLWRMPLDEAWSKEVESQVADIKNLGNGRYAGASTAAAFLQKFIENDTPWAHMDIAGTAWRKSDQPTVPKFGSGFGVRVLNDLVKNTEE